MNTQKRFFPQSLVIAGLLTGVLILPRPALSQAPPGRCAAHEQIDDEIGNVKAAYCRALGEAANWLVVGIFMLFVMALTVAIVLIYTPHAIHRCKPFDPARERKRDKGERAIQDGWNYDS